jgi:hypothetical protein
MPSPINTPIGEPLTAPVCLHCHVATIKARCPICSRKTAPMRLEKVAHDLAELDTGETFAIWPFERDRAPNDRPRRPTTHRIPGRATVTAPLGPSPPQTSAIPLIERIRSRER